MYVSYRSFWWVCIAARNRSKKFKNASKNVHSFLELDFYLICKIYDSFLQNNIYRYLVSSLAIIFHRLGTCCLARQLETCEERIHAMVNHRRERAINVAYTRKTMMHCYRIYRKLHMLRVNHFTCVKIASNYLEMILREARSVESPYIGEKIEIVTSE